MASNEELIGEGPITKTMIQEVLQKYFKTNAKITKTESDIISKGLGFTSDISRVQLTWNENENSLPKKVILKAPKVENVEKIMRMFSPSSTDDAPSGVSAQMIFLIHNSECNVYSILLSQDMVPIPKIYGHELVTDTHPGMIIMEDLSDHAGLIGNITDGVSLEKWAAIVDLLADLHAWSMTTDEPWKDKVNGMEVMFEFMKTMMSNALGGLKQTKEKYPEAFGHMNEELMLKQMQTDTIKATLTKFSQLMPEVMLHGDMWTNNIFFEKNPDGTLSDKIYALIDWQACLRSYGVYDITRFECWSLNHEMRHQHAKSMLRRYYDRLVAKSQGKVTTPFEHLEEMYEESKAMNGMFGALGAEMFLTMIAKVHEDETGWRKKEMLARLKAGYDEAEKFYKEKEAKETRD